MLDRRSALKNFSALGLLGAGAMSAACSRVDERGPAVPTSSEVDWSRRFTSLAKFSNDRIPGFAVAYNLGASNIVSDARGVTSVEGENPVTSDTVFQVASLTKPVFAALVMRLRERGIIDLDVPLLDYADYSDVSAVSEARAVTARLVLSHQTGLPNWRSLEDGETVAFLSPPGEAYGYSGEGYIWLQATLERLLGKSTRRLMREEVFEPLGMKRSALGYDHALFQDQNFASGHDENAQLLSDGKVKAVADIFVEQGFDLDEVGISEARQAIKSTPELSERFYNHPTFAPATASGSLVCTVADYARFMQVFTDSSGTNFLSADSKAEMLKPHADVKRYTSAGLGWLIEQTPTGIAFSHGGFNTGFKSFSLGRPDTNEIAVLATNSNEGDRLRWPIISGLTGAGEADILG